MEPSSSGGNSPNRKRPNFLVVVADDQCYRTLHALNNPEVHTPTFDRLLGRGTTFTHCFHQGSWTGAICVASRAMLHTGRYVWTCGGNDCGRYPLLGEVLQMAGYRAYGVGKWHNGDESALRSFNTGKVFGPGMYESGDLAYYRPRAGDPWTPWDPKYGGHWTPKVWDLVHSTPKDIWHHHYKGKWPGSKKSAGPLYEKHQHSCELYADTAIALLQETASRPDEPFFLYLAWNSPHDPRQSPKEFLDLYPPDKVEVPPDFLPEHPFDPGHYKGQGPDGCRDERLTAFPRTPEAVRLHRREYYALISYMDHQLGRILDALEATGQSDNTYVIVTGDHGLAVGEHGFMGKQNLYDCSIRMPFIVLGPGVKKGRRIDALMYQHCLFPTICDWAGIPAPATVQFPSLLPLLRGERDALFDSVYSGLWGFQRMVRTGRYKLVLYTYPTPNQAQLFDIEKDPWEMNNLAGDTALSRTVSGLFRELKKWQVTLGDPLALDPAAFNIKV